MRKKDELRQIHEKTPPHGNIDVEFFPSVSKVVITIMRDDGQKLACSMSYEEFKSWLEWAINVAKAEGMKIGSNILPP